MKTQTRQKLERLQPLDLSKCNTVGELVDGMSRCSFGARMLGDVANTLTNWIEEKEPPVLLLHGPDKNPLWNLIIDEGKGRFHLAAPDALPHVRGYRKLIVVGNYDDASGKHFYENFDEAIFINNEGRCNPGQIKDGYFPNTVFADPNFILPVLFDVLNERLGGKKKTIMQSLRDASKYGETPRQILHAVHTWEVMQRDPDCTVFMTLSGAMTVAQMSLLVCDMIEKERVDAIASTGALMAHGLIAGTGLSHFKYNPQHSDGVLAKKHLNRVTDTLEPETNFDHIDHIMNEVLSKLDGRNHSPANLHGHIGEYLSNHPKYRKVRGILRAAHEHKVPVFVPAFHDSEIGNDHYTHNLLRAKRGLEPLVINQEIDTKKLLDIFTGAKRLGIISIGGGVPRNHVQNLAPLTEIINARKAAKLPVKKFMYGSRMDPQLPWHGGMGGCTYEENMSWRKFFLKATISQLKMDATIVWPFVQKGLDERLEMTA